MHNKKTISSFAKIDGYCNISNSELPSETIHPVEVYAYNFSSLSWAIFSLISTYWAIFPESNSKTVLTNIETDQK